jgi:hypothetical protein
MSATAKTDARLSPLQRDLLRRLLACEQALGPAGEDDPPPAVPVKLVRSEAKKTPADSAAYSRAVRRLTWRGLVIPCNLRHGVRRGPNIGKVRIDPADKHTRADHLLLTAAGRVIARSLANAPRPAPAMQSVPMDPIPAQEPGSPPTPTTASAVPVASAAVVSVPQCQLCRKREAKPTSRFCDNCWRELVCIGALRLCGACHQQETAPNDLLCRACRAKRG